MWTSLILNGYRGRAVSVWRLNPLDVCLWGWMKSEVHKRRVDTQDKFLARILDALGCIRKREDQLSRTTRDLRTRVAKCAEVDGGIFEHLM